MFELRAAAKSALRTLLGDYQYYYLFRYTHESPVPACGQPVAPELLVRPIGQADMAASPDALIRDQTWYGGNEAQVFGGFLGEHLVGVCAYWFGTRYALQAGRPARGPDEAKLVQVVLLPAWRGRALGRVLIRRSAQAMHAQGFARLYARIWHSHRASHRAFAQAGWALVGALLEINPARRPRPWRLRLLWADGGPVSLRYLAPGNSRDDPGSGLTSRTLGRRRCGLRRGRLRRGGRIGLRCA